MDRAHRTVTALLSLVFGVGSALYIFFSDRLLASLTDDPAQITALQTYKGWGYVAGATALVYGLLRLARNLETRRADEAERARVALAAHRDRLEEEVLARTAELSAARAEAERTARLKAEQLASMSHEIRTPLNAVLGLAQIGARDGGGRQAFARIRESGQLLLAAVNDVLDFSKLEAGKLTFSDAPFTIGEVVDGAVDLLASAAHRKGLTLRVEEAAELPAEARGDAGRITRVLVNLLSNAVKFTEPGGQIVIGAARAGDALSLRVADTGVGIDEATLRRLFQPFEQASEGLGGTGLGLVICKRVVELMGGTIGVESRPGEGSTFTVTLPLGLDPAPPAPATTRTAALSCVPRADVDAVTPALRALGYAVRSLRGGQPFPAEAALAVVSVEALGEEQVRRAVDEALDRGQRVAVLAPPGAGELPPGLADRAALVEQPLRARHLAAVASGAAPRAAAARPSPRLAGTTILAADDDESARLVLRGMLEGEGARVLCAESGAVALSILRERGAAAFDALLTDVQMPGLDGYETARRARELGPTLPVIGLTAHTAPEERERCLAAGMVERLTKPLELEALVTLLKRHAGPRAESAAPALPAPPPSPSLDWAALSARLGGGSVGEVVAAALRTHGEAPVLLRAAAAERDAPAIAAVAHRLRGACGNLAAAEAFALARRVEVAARSGDDAAPALALDLADAAERLLAALAAGPPAPP